MECYTHLFEQIMKAVVDALPSLLDWVIKSLGG